MEWRLKAFVASFKGVSSKYLNNYLVWNNAVEHKGGSLREKATNILNFATSALFEETCLAVPMRPPLPILVKNQSKMKPERYYYEEIQYNVGDCVDADSMFECN